MLTGSDIRRYRKLLGMTQIGFARQCGVAQASLSAIEVGKTPVSEEHTRRLLDRFGEGQADPTFEEFRRSTELIQHGERAAFASPLGRFATLAVWAWEGFDLGREPDPASAVDLVTVRALGHAAIAVRVDRASSAWESGEILVFEECRPSDLADGELCLVHARLGRTKVPRTIIAIAHVSPAKRGHVLQLKPVSPLGPIFAGTDESILTTMRAIYRARHLPK